MIDLYSSSFEEKTGIGRHAISIFEIAKLNNHEISRFCILYPKFISNRFFQNLYYFLRSTLYFNRRSKKNISISTSVIAPFSTNYITFSSCHLYSVINFSRYGLISLLNPVSIFYLILEFIHYRNNKSVNIFLSNMELKQFETLYGKTKSKNIIVRPILSPSFFSKQKNKLNLHKKYTKLLFVAHNPRLKGLIVLLKLLSLDDNYFLDIVGAETFKKNNSLYKLYSRNRKRIKFLGKLNSSNINYHNYDFFVYPSNTDSYAFVVQEAIRNKLIPLVSDKIGIIEHIKVLNNNLYRNIICKKQDEVNLEAVEYHKKIIFFKKNYYKFSREIHKLSKSISNHNNYILNIINE